MIHRLTRIREAFMAENTHGLILSQLQMIEHTYDLTITNKDEICGWIIGATHNPREVLTIMLAARQPPYEKSFIFRNYATSEHQWGVQHA
jgi:hypothetical protein